MGKPHFSNSKLQLKQSMNANEGYSGALWLNLGDPKLEAAVVNKLSQDGNSLGIKISSKNADAGYPEVAQFNLFPNADAVEAADPFDDAIPGFNEDAIPGFDD
jgi:hypothetical protein|tara:strand:- start:186 stop:494 length:309 start_codon:yes stop_codon:yes gene_type:complete